MTNKKAPTKRQRDELARRKAMGIALIQRPLKFIQARTNKIEIKNGEPIVIESDQSKAARYFARYGDGASVNRMAFMCL